MAISSAGRAKRFNLDYNLTPERIEQKLRVGLCEVTFIPFVLDWDGRRRNPWCPTLDRKDSSRGYTLDNVSMVCWIYNAAKCDGPHSDVQILARGLTGALTDADINYVSGVAAERVAVAVHNKSSCACCGTVIGGRIGRKFCSVPCQVKHGCHEASDAPGCWVWAGAERENGYGVVNTEFGTMSPARAMYIGVNGKRPKNGWPVVNTCGTKNCCNPDHLVVRPPANA